MAGLHKVYNCKVLKVPLSHLPSHFGFSLAYAQKNTNLLQAKAHMSKSLFFLKLSLFYAHVGSFP